MRALILSCNTGGGHNAAGKALLEALTRRSIFCEMRDTLSFGSGKASRNVSGTYVSIARSAPAIFGTLYKAGQLISSPRLKSPVYLCNMLYADKLAAYIDHVGFDTVLCPHLFPAEALTYLRRRGRLNARVYGVATDYTCTPFWEETDIDGFFIACEELKQDYTKKGFAVEKLIPVGIPVMRNFSKRVDRQEARRSLGIEHDGRAYLCMTGSMGAGDVIDIAANLRKADPECMVLVLYGSSEKLAAAIGDRFSRDGLVKAIGFTDKVPLYMDACDVVLSKPGGLSSTETAVKNMPLVHTAPIPGCETINARFFSERGMSLRATTPEESARAAKALATDDIKASAMKEAQRRYINPRAADDICDYLSL